jgi:hypothetical protein
LSGRFAIAAGDSLLGSKNNNTSRTNYMSGFLFLKDAGNVSKRLLEGGAEILKYGGKNWTMTII